MGAEVTSKDDRTTIFTNYILKDVQTLVEIFSRMICSREVDTDDQNGSVGAINGDSVLVSAKHRCCLQSLIPNDSYTTTTYCQTAFRVRPVVGNDCPSHVGMDALDLVELE